jgi:DNA polymerase-1
MNSFLLIKRLPDLIELAVNWKYKEFAFDTETTDVKIDRLKITGLSLCGPDLQPIYIQFNFKAKYFLKEKDPKGGRKKIKVWYDYEHTDGIDFDDALPYLLMIFTGAEVICANAKFDINVARKYNFYVFTLKDDTQLMSYVWDVNKKHGLKELGKRLLNEVSISYAEVTGMSEDNIIWPEVDFYAYGQYGAKDSWLTIKCRDVLMRLLRKDELLLQCYQQLELPLIPYVANSEYLGVEIDIPMLEAMGKEVLVEIDLKEQEIFDKCGVEFNLGSPKQLGEVLYDRLGLECTQFTATGNRSVSESALKELAFKGYELPDMILEYRSLKKLYSTYIKAIPEKVGTDGRLHCSFNQGFTATGRFSCVSEDTLIHTNIGLVPIGSFVPDNLGEVDLNGEVKTLTHKGDYQPITKGINKGYESMYEVELENGYVIECTLDHKFLTDDGWKTLEELLFLFPESNQLICYDEKK